MQINTKYLNEAGVYKLTCIVNGKIYIGKSVNLYQRLNFHKKYSGTSRNRCLLQNAILKHGWDSFTVEILETVKDFDKSKDNLSLLERESHYIELFDSTDRDKGYNRCKHSNDLTGVSLSEETKNKMRQAKLGKPKTEKHRESLRQAKLGKPNLARLGVTLSDETKEKIRQSKKGVPRSEETKEKIRQAKLKK